MTSRRGGENPFSVNLRSVLSRCAQFYHVEKGKRGIGQGFEKVEEEATVAHFGMRKIQRHVQEAFLGQRPRVEWSRVGKK